MKAQLKCGPNLTIEVEGSDQTTVFQAIAQAQEIFDAETKCGLCSSTELRFVFRVAQDKYDYYELRCLACGARFAFGQKQQPDKGKLFPKRKDENGAFLPGHGWSIYKPAQADPSEQHAEPRGRSAPPNRSAPAQTGEHGPMLREMYDRMRAEGPEPVVNDLCLKLDALIGAAGTDSAWTEITNRIGDPKQNAALYRLVVEELVKLVYVK